MTIKIDKTSIPAPRVSEVVRDFIGAGGRILVTQAGELTEGAGVPWPFVSGTDAEAVECLRAGRAYFGVRDLPLAEHRIMRTVRALGRRTENGWLVLASPSKPKEVLH